MALPMKKSVMKSMKAMKKTTAMKARVMKKKAVSKIARGKSAKAVVFRGSKEKTATGFKQTDLLKNKRNKVVTKKQHAAGKKAYKKHLRLGPPQWTKGQEGVGHQRLLRCEW